MEAMVLSLPTTAARVQGDVMSIKGHSCSLDCTCGRGMRFMRSAQTTLGLRWTLECRACEGLAYLFTEPLFYVRRDEIPQGMTLGQYAQQRAEEIRDNQQLAMEVS